ncbi:MAG TPA: lycopene cyclase domain-containing protein [Candidatus Saccharimonadales bacterium]|nr:lycopene cyclase domain-containing protein [Candidatus Saccharimonadales bacterium]
MNSHWLYLYTTIFFAGIGNFRIWYRHGGFLKRHWKYIAVFVIITLPITVFEYFARRWGAWNYHPQHVLNIHVFGAEIETYLFMAMVAAALAGASFTYAQMEEHRKIKHRVKRRHSSRRALAWSKKP